MKLFWAGLLGIFFLGLSAFAFQGPPQRIISGIPAITEMLYAISAESQVVGVTTNCNYPPAAQKKAKVGGFFLNLETIVALHPDLIVMQGDAQAKDIKRFKKFGLPVCVLKLKSVADVLAEMLRLGEVVDRSDEAKKYVASLEARLAKVGNATRNYQPRMFDVLKIWNPRVKQRKALVIVGLNPLIVVGEGSFIDDVLKRAGVGNVAAGVKGEYPQYSFEKLVADNPQYIIIPQGLVDQEKLAKNRRWRSLEAVRAGRVLQLDADVLSRPGPRVVTAVEQIAAFVYR